MIKKKIGLSVIAGLILWSPVSIAAEEQYNSEKHHWFREGVGEQTKGWQQDPFNNLPKLPLEIINTIGGLAYPIVEFGCPSGDVVKQAAMNLIYNSGSEKSNDGTITFKIINCSPDVANSEIELFSSILLTAGNSPFLLCTYKAANQPLSVIRRGGAGGLERVPYERGTNIRIEIPSTCTMSTDGGLTWQVLTKGKIKGPIFRCHPSDLR